MREIIKLESGEKVAIYSPKEAPFSIHGLYNQPSEEVYKRLPDEIGLNTNEGVNHLYLHTAGGRVRFATDSEFIYLKVKLPCLSIMKNMCITGTNGFDLYEMKGNRQVYKASFMPTNNPSETTYFEIKHFGNKKMREYTLNMPLYNNVVEFFIGLEEDAVVKEHSPYEIATPVVFYGSSITQGGCASRPGLAYQSFISRKLNCDFINLGFSGSARAEKIIVDYMAGLEMSAFVCDYDHNAPNIEHLRNTHYNVYDTIRKAHPDIPIIFVTKPDFSYERNDDDLRREAIFATYQKALLASDKRVAFVDGQQLFGTELREDCSVDGCHPNDLGFSRMGEVIGKAIEGTFARIR